MERSEASRLFLTLLVCSVGLAQDPPNPEGGRDTGGGRAIHFVRWHKSAEAGAIYNAAWRALEPHLLDLGRRRLVDFDGDPEKARAYFAEAKDVALVVAFGAEAARAVPKGPPVLEVSESPTADVVLRVDRERLSVLVKLLRAKARVALFGPVDEKLSDLETRRCETAADASGCDLAWVAEGGVLPEGVTLPVVATAMDVPATLSVRPDATSAGMKVASLVVRKLRDGREFERQRVARLRVTVDLGAMPSTEVDPKLLAHADAVRREQ
ncbi:MAG: hypothetical protein ACHQ1G_12535 [Planctomycetota bacterium]